MRYLITGGPGNISRATIKNLLEDGHEVGVFTHRDKSDIGLLGTTVFNGERSDKGALGEVISAYEPDVIVDFICYSTEDARNICELAKDKVQRIVYISTVDVYGYPLSRVPFRECDEYMPPVSEYAKEKLAAEVVFKESGIPLTICRPAYSMGKPFVLSPTRFYAGHLVCSINKGEEVLVPDDGKGHLHASAAINTGRMIAKIVQSERTIGEDFTCAHPYATTQDDYVELVAKVCCDGKKPIIKHIPHEYILENATDEIKYGPIATLGQFDISFSIEKFMAFFPDFKFEYTLEEAIGEWREANVGYFNQDLPTSDETLIVRKWAENL